MSKEILITQVGLEEITKELEYLKNEKRHEVIEALKEARALGDLSENAEYDSARNDQAIVEARIKELEYTIENAKVVAEINTDKVTVGNSVKLEYIEDAEIETYHIVGSKEADPFNNKISNESPIVEAIIGRSTGETVTVNSPNGKYDVKIVEIF